MAASDLVTSLQNIDTQIVNITANPKPNYTINGQSISWGDFLKQLMDMRQQIAKAVVIAQGPNEDVWEGLT